MHASSFVFFALAACLVAAAPAPHVASTTASSAALVESATTHHLERRQLNPISLGVGSAAVDIARSNERVAVELREKCIAMRAELSQLQGREQILHTHAPRLMRRQLGTLLGSVGIHKNKHNEETLHFVRNEVAFLRAGTNKLLEAEHLEHHGTAPHEQGETNHDQDIATDEASDEPFPEEEGAIEESSETDEAAAVDESSDAAPAEGQPRLQRRFLGIILSPIAMSKARKQQHELQDLQREVEHIRADLARVRTSQDVRMRIMNGATIVPPAHAGPGFMRGSSFATTAITPAFVPGEQFSSTMVTPMSSGVMGMEETRPSTVIDTVHPGPAPIRRHHPGTLPYPPRSSYGNHDHHHDHHHDDHSAYGRPHTMPHHVDRVEVRY